MRYGAETGERDLASGECAATRESLAGTLTLPLYETDAPVGRNNTNMVAETLCSPQGCGGRQEACVDAQQEGLKRGSYGTASSGQDKSKELKTQVRSGVEQ